MKNRLAGPAIPNRWSNYADTENRGGTPREVPEFAIIADLISIDSQTAEILGKISQSASYILRLNPASDWYYTVVDCASDKHVQELWPSADADLF
jgi:hypothetical protein